MDDGAAVGDVDAHVDCLGCGYDLHGLARDGVCPECGHSIRKSLAIGHADPEWLKSVNLGLELLLQAHYLLLMTIVICVLLPLGAVLFVVFAIAGSMRLARHDPMRPMANRLGQNASGLIAFGGVFIVWGLLMMRSNPDWQLPLIVVGLISFFVGFVTVWIHIRMVMQRGISVRAAQLGLILAVMIGMVGFFVVVWLCFSSQAWFGTSAIEISEISGFAAAVLGFASLICAIVTLHIARKATARAIEICEAMKEARLGVGGAVEEG